MYLDLRAPWTIKQDGIGDLVINALDEALTMESLLDDRRRAVGPPLSGGRLIDRFELAINPIQRTVRPLRQVTKPLIDLALERDVSTGIKISWSVTITVIGPHVASDRQSLRIVQALAELVRNRSHLSDQMVDVGVNNLVITLKAEIGVLVEPPVSA